jgi:nitrile hydratase
VNGIHDVGGMQGLGPVNAEENEPVFHNEWERRVFALAIATFGGGNYNVDEFRHGIERMNPAHYLATSYYEHWLYMVETLMIEKGAITSKELDAERAKVAEAGA